MPEIKHAEHGEIDCEQKGAAVEKRSIFVRAKETVYSIFSSIRDGLRRAFYWVKSKFSPSQDDSNV